MTISYLYVALWLYCRLFFGTNTNIVSLRIYSCAYVTVLHDNCEYAYFLFFFFVIFKFLLTLYFVWSFGNLSMNMFIGYRSSMSHLIRVTANIYNCIVVHNIKSRL